MKKKTYKTQTDLFSCVLDKYVENEETCISEFCVKNKPQAYENLKTERNHLAEEWNRLTEEREMQIRADAIREFAKWEDSKCINYSEFDTCEDVVKRYFKQLKEQNAR